MEFESNNLKYKACFLVLILSVLESYFVLWLLKSIATHYNVLSHLIIDIYEMQKQIYILCEVLIYLSKSYNHSLEFYLFAISSYTTARWTLLVVPCQFVAIKSLAVCQQQPASLHMNIPYSLNPVIILTIRLKNKKNTSNTFGRIPNISLYSCMYFDT